MKLKEFFSNGSLYRNEVESVFQCVVQVNCSQPNWSRKLAKNNINKPAWKNRFRLRKNSGVGLESLMDFSSRTRCVSAKDVIVKFV